MTQPDIVPPASPLLDTSLGEGLRIGLFDSGLGGLSVLRDLRQHMPLAQLLYVADSGNAPYGERDDAFIAGRALAISEFLLSQGAQVIVVACNTATAMAVHTLRQRWPELPIVGVEPGVKPAVAVSVNKRIGVLATPGTLASDKFKRLIEMHGQDALIVLQPCPGLAKEIEAGHLDSPALRALVETFSQPLREAQVDTVVLGCTHYPFVAPLFQQALGPKVRIIDTAQAVARQTQRVSAELPRLPRPDYKPTTQLWTSGSVSHLAQVADRWLDLKAQVSVFP
ncbi:glutamate racemase [Aquabacterium sp. CECT 9606]|uniref:glutamate racemase n=1 Tax=Aquabacterium sp. CECT 9606 TaxID=2845822 RepID=UPI001E441357|nr:glutamate racemase [Aquabacterium sp. CECT 9606]CAH0356267.1 Glutamate racemase [Aquabacterium sp. CECT 9606]